MPFPCPACLADMQCISTRRTKTMGVVRRYRCTRCAKRLSTREIVIGEADKWQRQRAVLATGRIANLRKELRTAIVQLQASEALLNEFDDEAPTP